MKKWGVILLILITLAGIIYAIISRTPGRGEVTPLHVNLRESPVYIKSGFDRSDVNLTDVRNQTGVWTAIGPLPSGKAPAVKIKDLNLGGKPKRNFLSPFRVAEQEFTMLIPFSMSAGQAAMLAVGNPLPPGFFFASLGDNWEVFLNGTLVKSELHLDNDGRIASGRTWRRISFPVDKSLFRVGENLLVLRIVGDPTFNGTGLFYASPYYLDTYAAILKRNSEIVSIALYAIYFFVGLNHFLMFLASRHERYNLYYSILSLLLGIYFLSRTAAIYTIIPDSNIMERIEYGSLFMVVPAFAAFFELLNVQKIRLPTKLYGAFCGFLTLTQGVFPLQYGYDALVLWEITALIGSLYVFIRHVIYPFFFIAYNQWNSDAENVAPRNAAAGKRVSLFRVYKNNLIETPLGNLLIGFVFLFATALFDIIDAFFLNNGLTLSRYSFFIFTIGTSFILARNIRQLYDTVTQTQVLQGQLAAYARRINTIEDLQRQTGEIRHEFKNMLFTLKIDMEQKNYEGVNNRIWALLGELKQAEPERYTGNSLIDAVISYKAAQIRELGAAFSVQADPLELETPGALGSALPYDIASIMGIALDNVADAIGNLVSNASMEAGERTVPAVGCKIQSQKNMLMIKVSNPLPEPLQYKNGEIQTTKTESGHGLGLPALRRVVQKYGGEVRVSAEDGIFSLSAMLFV